MGAKVGGEFHVNTNTANDQVSPAVAMDSFGDFVVVWASQAQSYSYFNTLKGQIYDLDGNTVGGEFSVNSQNIPSTGLTASNNVLHPSIDMSDVGTFVVVWTNVVSQTNNVATNSVVVGDACSLWDATGVTRHQHRTSSKSASEDNQFIADGTGHCKRSFGRAALHGEQRAGGDERLGPVRRHLGSLPGQRLDRHPPADVVNSYGVYYRQFAYDSRRHLTRKPRWTNRPTKSSPRWIQISSTRWRNRRFTTAIS